MLKHVTLLPQHTSYKLTFFNPSHNGGKVVIQQNHVSCLLGDIWASNTHSNTNVSLLQGWRIIHTITCDCYNGTLVTKRETAWLKSSCKMFLAKKLSPAFRMKHKKPFHFAVKKPWFLLTLSLFWSGSSREPCCSLQRRHWTTHEHVGSSSPKHIQRI